MFITFNNKTSINKNLKLDLQFGKIIYFTNVENFNLL
jgi:hypothetical protein